jgi:membrane protein YqaA with SNARE-associated domain
MVIIYATLFFSAFVSATLFPMGSEALLIYDIEQGYDLTLLLISATIGNTLGALINYWMGLGGEKLLIERGVVHPERFTKFIDYFQRYGAWTLLLSWMPIVGDLFTFAAGVARYNIWRFILLVLVAKAGRYILLAWGWMAI